jgi:hypothetical protein
LETLTEIVRENEIKLATISGLGAVSKIVFGYYDQVDWEYNFIEREGQFEILSLNGNVSLKDGKPMIHAHIMLADDTGDAFGGHLAEGTKVFASEIEIQELTEADKVRKYDEDTGLTLW